MGKRAIFWSGLFVFFSACIRTLAKAPMDRDTSIQGNIPLKPETVVLMVCVDKDGTVVSAVNDLQKSTTSDTVLINKSIKAANQYRFSPSSHKQECGSITFNYQLKNDSLTTKY